MVKTTGKCKIIALVMFILLTAIFVIACDSNTSENQDKSVGIDEIVVISTFNDFMNISSEKGRAYELANDIDCGGAVLAPIGTASQPFEGQIDGKGFMISNFIIDESSIRTNDNTGEYDVGVFGVVGNATIQNITFANFNINIDEGSFDNVVNCGLIAESQADTQINLSNISIDNMEIKVSADNVVFGSFVARDMAFGTRSQLALKNSYISILTNGEFTLTPIAIGGLFGQIGNEIVIDSCVVAANSFEISYMGMGAFNFGLVAGSALEDAVIKISNTTGENINANIMSFGESTLVDNLVGFKPQSATILDENNEFINCEMFY